MKNLNIEQAMVACRLACGSEAVAHGFPPEAGHDSYDGIVADDTQGWSDQDFLNWTYKMDAKYKAAHIPGTNSFMGLYGDCSKVIGQYGGMLKPNQPIQLEIAAVRNPTPKGGGFQDCPAL